MTTASGLARYLAEQTVFISYADGRVVAAHWAARTLVAWEIIAEGLPTFVRARVDGEGRGRLLIRTTDEWALYRLRGWFDAPQGRLLADLVARGRHARNLRVEG